MIRVQLLGPVRAWRDGDELDLGGPQQKAVLGLLAADAAADRPTPMTELIDALWPGRPPASATNVIQTYLKRLRQLFEPDRPPRTPGRLVQRVAGGYMMDISHVDVDVVRFRQLVAAAAGTDQYRAAEQLREALRWWQGTPMSNVDSLLSGHPTVTSLLGERWTAVARYGEAMLATGKAAEALPALVEAAASCPLDEGAQARLIRAYHAAGNRAQAFGTYHAARRRLAEELGIDPGPELTAAHDALLSEDRGRAEAGSQLVPAQLPPATAMFTGRTEELQQLDKLLPAHGGMDTVVIATIVGAAGIGKTTLAVRWARQVADRFPDGQLFVNLRGFDPSGPVMGPGEAIRGFLDALGVRPQQIPATLEAQVGLYRTLLSRRRMLVVLDNARDAAQIRPLLPGASGCLALVTSRDELAGLVATEGAVPLRPDLLSVQETAELLARRLGADRVAGEPDALAEIVRRCAGLPLALVIVAGRAAARPEFGLATVVEQLRETSTGLDPFTGGDPATDLRAVLSWSYQALTPAAARLFRQLAVHPGPDISASAAASLGGVPAARVRPVLAELTRSHLVAEPAPARFALHDLLRAYATELADTVDSEEDRVLVRHRILDHYLHTAYAARHQLNPALDPISLDPPHAAVTPEPVTDREGALTWLATERPVLLACVTRITGPGLDAKVWQLVREIEAFLDYDGHWHDQVTAHAAGLAAAERLGDLALQARSHAGIGTACVDLGELDRAHHHLERSLALYQDGDDQVEEAGTHCDLGYLACHRGRYQDAIAHYGQALQLFQTAGLRRGEGHCLNGIGWNHALLGEHARALDICQQALTVFAEAGARHDEGVTWDSIGYAHHHLGDLRQAVDSYDRALALHRTFGHRYHEATTLTRLGDTHQALGDLDHARTVWRAALAILDELGHADADQIHARLADLGS